LIFWDIRFTIHSGIACTLSNDQRLLFVWNQISISYVSRGFGSFVSIFLPRFTTRQRGFPLQPLTQNKNNDST
jgi:hypothetical protein